MPQPPIPESHLYGPAEPERRLRLMEVVRRKFREGRYSRRTEQAYIHWIRRYIAFNGRRHPRGLGAEDVRRFLSDLAVRQQVAASTQNQALGALQFLYAKVLGAPLPRIEGLRLARRSQFVPVVMSQHEVRQLLRRLSEPLRLCAQLMYGGGLRVSECMSLRVKDVDIDRREIVVRGGKGNKDRRTPLADSCIAGLERQFKGGLKAFMEDRRLGVRVTGLSPALNRKYPRADSTWPWWYIFPATRTFTDGGGIRRRHHLHESVRVCPELS